MFRVILAIVLGAVFGVCFIASGDMAIHLLFPMETPPTDPTQLAEYIHEMPAMSKVLVVVNWALAGFLAACITNLIQGRTNYKPMFVTVGLLQILTYLNLAMVPVHPGWMWVAVTFIYIPTGFISYWLLRKRHNEYQN